MGSEYLETSVLNQRDQLQQLFVLSKKKRAVLYNPTLEGHFAIVKVNYVSFCMELDALLQAYPGLNIQVSTDSGGTEDFRAILARRKEQFQQLEKKYRKSSKESGSVSSRCLNFFFRDTYRKWHQGEDSGLVEQFKEFNQLLFQFMRLSIQMLRGWISGNRKYLSGAKSEIQFEPLRVGVATKSFLQGMYRSCFEGDDSLDMRLDQLEKGVAQLEETMGVVMRNAADREKFATALQMYYLDSQTFGEDFSSCVERSMALSAVCRRNQAKREEDRVQRAEVMKRRRAKAVVEIEEQQAVEVDVSEKQRLEETEERSRGLVGSGLKPSI